MADRAPRHSRYPGHGSGNHRYMRIRVAAAGDIHGSEEERTRPENAFMDAERECDLCTVNGVDVGIVGTKGFVGGFSGSLLPDFGEPLLRRVYAETSAEVSAIDRGLQRVCDCPIRIVLLHYSPTVTTIQGEPETIWTFLGSERLAEPIAQHRPDVVLHGHGHRGSFAGQIDNIPVYNVGVPVIGRDFWVFEFDERGLVREPQVLESA